MKHIANLAAIKAYRPKPLTQESHQALSKVLNKFVLKNTHLIYQHEFPANSYLNTLEKMNRIGLIADEMDHHPEWTLTGDKLSIGLSTHEIGGEVSWKDYVLAYWIEHILNSKTIEEEVVEEWNKLEISYD